MTRKHLIVIWLFNLILTAAVVACTTAEELVPASGPAPAAPIQQAAPAPAVDHNRQAAEAALLASTIRLEIHGAGISHGTVMNGRYLVTHNHFPFDLTAISDSYPAKYSAFSLYRTDGSPLIARSPLTNIVVAGADAEMLILDFGDFSGQGFFNFLGIPSAEFDVQVDLAAGAEVAQVNWDGATARIDWVTVREVRLENGVSALVLDNPLQAGASGGGVFWNGRHVANNWSTQQVEGVESGTIIDAYSVAATNHALLNQPGLVQQAPEPAQVTDQPAAETEEMPAPADKGI